MPSIDLPANGEQPWGDKLSTAIESINVEVDYQGSLMDGGTTGQAWVKASDDDRDIEWGDVVASDGSITNIVSITRTAYDALGSYDPQTLYLIDEEA